MKLSNSVKAMGLCLLLINLGNSALAHTKTHQPARDDRIHIIPYREDVVIPIYGTVFVVTQILFSPQESIVDIQSGDADAWTVNVNKTLPYILNIKPTAEASHTDLSVVTMHPKGEIRRYYFELISDQQLVNNKQHLLTYALRFTYPTSHQHSSGHKNINHQHSILPEHPSSAHKYHWDYTFHGAKQIMPLRIFDDGHFTYMQLAQMQRIPAVFVVDNKKGIESLANYRREGDYLVILSVAPQFTLRDGRQHVASIFNRGLIEHQKGR